MIPHYGETGVEGSNAYLGRAEADVTGFVEYFCTGMATACMNVRAHTQCLQGQGMLDLTALARALRPAVPGVSPLQADTPDYRTRTPAFFACTPRQARALWARWVREGFLELADPSKKARRYQLVPRYEALIVRSLS